MRDLLLLCNRPACGSNAETITDHIDSLKQLPGFRTFELSCLGGIPETIDLNRFDAVAIHYTLHLSDPNDYYLGKAAQTRIAAFRGLKCIWLHDEYRRVDSVANKMAAMGIDVIFSLASVPVLERLYPKAVLPRAKLVTVLAGYVPPEWMKLTPTPISQRPIDVSYRARRPPFWLGALGQEKVRIGDGFMRLVTDKGFRLNISVEEEDRVYGDEWRQLVANSKAVLCVESGASVIDFTGGIEAAVEAAILADPAIEFGEVSRRFMTNVDGQLMINPISPRVFEAAVTRTVMVAFEGGYSGLLVAWRNYIPLRKDFSNLDEVLSALGSDELLERIAENTYQDLVASRRYSYDAFADYCARIMADEWAARQHEKCSGKSYSRWTYLAALFSSPTYVLHHYIGQSLQRLLLGSKIRHLMFRFWRMLPASARTGIRPLLRIIGR